MTSLSFYHFKSLASTQNKAKEFSKKGLRDLVVVSDTQTKGHGRFGRKWHSTKGGLWMSILLKPDNTKNAQYLTFAAAISVVKAIKKITGIDTKIKWPNDVHYNGKKLCGILTQTIFGKENYIIVGIGLNANQSTFPSEIKNTATSLKIATNKIAEINKLSKNITGEFFRLYTGKYRKNKLNYIMKQWKKHCDTIGQNVAVISRTRTFKGKAIGVDKNCSLLLKSGKRTIKIIEGDIRARH
jgi:BirA family transcriptional regulator, biotin operon repressor / biotin---[acetyl-CoA-carboxylase] ligase